MMVLQLTLYFLIGVICLFFSKFRSMNEWTKAILLVAFWPFYILLKYVESVDSAKKKDQKPYED